ncbi:MAG: type III pantothenate kinase [Aureibaculum sp.]
MNLIIDIGNTRSKIAVFDKKTLLQKIITDNENIDNTVKKFQKKYALRNCIISSVSNFDTSTIKKLKTFSKVIELGHQTSVPFINKYSTPKTLGVDRIALACAAVDQYPKRNVLIIDAGTCITFDYVNSKEEYLGGAISPGIGIRYKSLHKFTANLPLLDLNEFKLIGNDTVSSIHSGVLNGIVNEIDGVINQYISNFQTLTVVLTGGDINFLSKNLKSTIFANPNFLLEGLNSILIHNLDE